MRTWITIFLGVSFLGGVLAACARPEGIGHDEGTIDTSRMLSSEQVTDQRLGYERAIVGLQFFYGDSDFRSFCTGVLIRPDVVLTAAHCFDPRLVSVPILIKVQSTSDLNALAPGSWHGRAIKKKILHPMYNSRGVVVGGIDYPFYDHDLAVVLLAGLMDSSITPAALPPAGESIKAGTRMTAYGYGTSADITDSPGYAPRKYFGTLQRGTFIASGKNLEDRILTTPDSPSSVCQGDSGGPVFIKNAKGGAKLVAINSGTNGKFLTGKTGLRLCRGESVLQPLAPSREWLDGALQELGRL